MLFFLVTTRTARLALYVSVIVFFSVGSGASIGHASCGDYLQHARLSSKKDLLQQSSPAPICRGGSCRSAPSWPPVEPARVVVSERQPLDFQQTDTCFDSLKLRSLEFFDDELPSSTTLEVTTPPPIH